MWGKHELWLAITKSDRHANTLTRSLGGDAQARRPAAYLRTSWINMQKKCHTRCSSQVPMSFMATENNKLVRHDQRYQRAGSQWLKRILHNKAQNHEQQLKALPTSNPHYHYRSGIDEDERTCLKGHRPWRRATQWDKQTAQNAASELKEPCSQQE